MNSLYGNAIIGIVMSVLAVVIVIVYLKKMDCLPGFYKENNSRNHKWKTTAAVGIIFAITFVIFLFLSEHTKIRINIFKLFFLYCIILAAAAVDKRKKIIPNQLVICGLIGRIIFLGLEAMFFRDTLKEILINDLYGFILGFVVLAVIAVLTRQAIGYGDVKLFGVIGVTGGFLCTYFTLFMGMIAAAAASVFLLVTKKKDKKGSIPFAPCIYIGYVITILLTAY